MNVDPIGGGDAMRLVGQIVFGGRSVSTWILRRSTRHSADGGEVQQRFLFDVENDQEDRDESRGNLGELPKNSAEDHGGRRFRCEEGRGKMIRVSLGSRSGDGVWRIHD